MFSLFSITSQPRVTLRVQVSELSNCKGKGYKLQVIWLVVGNRSFQKSWTPLSTVMQTPRPTRLYWTFTPHSLPPNIAAKHKKKSGHKWAVNLPLRQRIRSNQPLHPRSKALLCLNILCFSNNKRHVRLIGCSLWKLKDNKLGLQITSCNKKPMLTIVSTIGCVATIHIL